MKRFTFVIIASIILSACGSSASPQSTSEQQQRAVASAVAATMAAQPTTPADTTTPAPTATSTTANTPKPTNTPRPTNTPAPTETSTAQMGTRFAPFPYRSVANLSPTRNLSFTRKGNIEFTLEVLNVVRGDAAWQQIKADNQFNTEPPAGMEYMLVMLKVEHTGTDPDVLQFNGAEFASVSNGHVFFEALNAPIVSLKNAITDAKLFAGASAQGQIAIPVFIDDTNPLLIFGMNSADNSGGFYFALSE